ncbi:MAG: hypothetical protein OEU92_06935 [Alphaproteobacteria bacterium]|nr:hypothetical protein [Alphaproteobacteria bacterium]
MTTNGRSRRGWLIACTALAAVIVYQWRSAVPLAPPVTAVEIDAAALDAVEPARFQPPTVDIVTPIVERPLFAASRRPSEPEAPAAPEGTAEQGKLLNLRVVGTMVTGEARTALLRQDGVGIRRIRLGDDLCGWRIARIDQTGVTLMHKDEIFRLDLPTPPRKSAEERATSIRCALQRHGGARLPSPPDETPTRA